MRERLQLHPGRPAQSEGAQPTGKSEPRRQQARELERGLRRDACDDRQPVAEVPARPLGEPRRLERRRLAPGPAPGHTRRRQPREHHDRLDDPPRRAHACVDQAVPRPTEGRQVMLEQKQTDQRSVRRDHARVFVTGDCDGLPDLRDALANHPEIELVGSASQVSEAAPTLTGGHLQVVLHATRSSTLPVNEVAPLPEPPRAPIVLLASNGSPALLEEALEHDVADVLLLPQLTDNVVFAIRKASHVGKRLTGSARRYGRLVTVFSPKGGTGKTVTATNLGASLAKHWGKRALLLDLDLQFGDAAIMLGIEPDKTIYDLVTAPGELVTEAKRARLLEVARESYDVIVVDTSPFFHGPMLATLDRTDELLLLCGLDVPTLKNVRLSLQTLELLSFPPERIKLVLNRANSKVGMKPKEVEAALEREIAYEVPSDRSVPIAVNRGNPCVLSDPKAEFSRALRAMAKQLVAECPRELGLRVREHAWV